MSAIDTAAIMALCTAAGGLIVASANALVTWRKGKAEARRTESETDIAADRELFDRQEKRISDLEKQLVELRKEYDGRIEAIVNRYEKELRELHQQHLECERTQAKQTAKIERLESEIGTLKQINNRI